jgi:hypothetical protein
LILNLREEPIGNRQLEIGNDLVHAVGLAPTKSLRTPDLQSGAFAAQPHMQNQIRYAKK